MRKSLYLLGVVLTVLALYVTFFSPTPTLLTPLSTNNASLEHGKTGTQDYVILGFAPYWNLKKLSPESLTSITHFTYFHLLLNVDGSIYTKLNKREEDPGYTNYKRLISGTIDHGTKPLLITFMPESQTALSNVVATSQSRQATIATIVTVIAESNATGVNIDFEPVGDSLETTKQNFTDFIKELRTQLDKLDGHDKLLTISVYASSATRPRIWDLASLAPYVNYFVIMTYDYTMPGNNSAGPNAPLRGSGDLMDHDIVKNIAEISALIPSKKILLGIPFYGYEWDTIDNTKYSPAQNKGTVASLERVQKMLDEKTLELVWDRDTLTPYGISTSSGQTSQIYFENDTSIRLKLNFVKSANLGGIAIWALGYEGNGSWVWPTINTLGQ